MVVALAITGIKRKTTGPILGLPTSRKLGMGVRKVASPARHHTGIMVALVAGQAPMSSFAKVGTTAGRHQEGRAQKQVGMVMEKVPSLHGMPM